MITQMAESIEVKVYRHNPETGEEPACHNYLVPGGKNNTVLGILRYIQEKLDPTLAFRFSCRYGRCGLCAVFINNRPALACGTKLRKGMEITPLKGLPLIKDLVIDRRALFDDLRKHSLYLNNGNENRAGLLATIKEPKEGALLRSCLECFSCLSSCPRYSFGKADFAGPYFFVKLAQLHFDPRDRANRLQQARELGIKYCLQCDKKCYCVAGIGIFKNAIVPLLDG